MSGLEPHARSCRIVECYIVTMGVKRLTNRNLRAVRGGRLRNIWFTDIRCRIGFLALFFMTATARAASQCDSNETSNVQWKARIAARVFTEKGRQAVTREEFNSAIFNFGQAIKKDPSFSPAYYYRGLTRVKLNDFRGAIADFDIVLRFDPNFAKALNDRGFARQQLGDTSGANNDFDHAVALDAESPLPYFNRARLKLIAGDENGAIRDLARALAFEPHFERRAPGLDSFFYYRARIECSKMEWNTAIADFNLAIEHHPTNIYAHIGRILARWCLENVGN